MVGDLYKRYSQSERYKHVDIRRLYMIEFLYEIHAIFSNFLLFLKLLVVNNTISIPACYQ